MNAGGLLSEQKLLGPVVPDQLVGGAIQGVRSFTQHAGLVTDAWWPPGSLPGVKQRDLGIQSGLLTS